MALPIQVGFVIQKLAGLTGGAERVLIETAKAMQARGFKVSILTFDTRQGAASFDTGAIPVRSLFPFPRSAQEPRDGAHRAGRSERLIKSIPNIFPFTHLKWHLSHGAFARALRRAIRNDGINVVVGFLPPAITASVTAARGLGVPVIASTHNLPNIDFGDSLRWDQNPLYRARARAALAEAHRITVLLPEFISWFPAALQDRITILPNAVGRLSPPSATARGKTILGVGRLTTIKRYAQLIEAFARLSFTFPDWHLRILGDGPERAKLQKQVQSLGLATRITLAGNTREIGAEYDRASILAHPSEFEGFGLSVAEAQVHGLPVVAFADCPGVNGLVRDGVSGYLVSSEPDPAANLAEALARLMQSSDLRAEMGRAAAAIAARFDADAIYDQWAVILHDAALTRR